MVLSPHPISHSRLPRNWLDVLVSVAALLRFSRPSALLD
jgi:hypothetical protein